MKYFSENPTAGFDDRGEVYSSSKKENSNFGYVGPYIYHVYPPGNFDIAADLNNPGLYVVAPYNSNPDNQHIFAYDPVTDSPFDLVYQKSITGFTEGSFTVPEGESRISGFEHSWYYMRKLPNGNFDYFSRPYKSLYTFAGYRNLPLKTIIGYLAILKNKWIDSLNWSLNALTQAKQIKLAEIAAILTDPRNTQQRGYDAEYAYLYDERVKPIDDNIKDTSDELSSGFPYQTDFSLNTSTIKIIPTLADQSDAIFLEFLKLYFRHSILQEDTFMKAYGTEDEFAHTMLEQLKHAGTSNSMLIGNFYAYATQNLYNIVLADVLKKRTITDYKVDPVTGQPNVDITPIDLTGTSIEQAALLLANAGKPEYPTYKEICAAFTLTNVGDYTNFIYPPPADGDSCNILIAILGVVLSIVTMGVGAVIVGAALKYGSKALDRVTGWHISGIVDDVVSVATAISTGGVAAGAISLAKTELKQVPFFQSAIGGAFLNVAGNTVGAEAAGEASASIASQTSDMVDPAAQAAAVADLSDAALQGSEIGSNLAALSASDDIQATLVDMGTDAAKTAIIKEAAKKGGSLAEFAAGAVLNNTDMSASLADNISNITNDVQNQALDYANTIDDKINNITDTMANFPENAQNMVDKAQTAMENDPRKVVNDILNAGSAILNNNAQKAVAAKAAQLAAAKMVNFTEVNGTVKNMITGQTYQAFTANNILQSVSESELSNNGFSGSAIQANLANNAFRLNTQILHVPDVRITPDQRVANAAIIQTAFLSRNDVLNTRIMNASNNYEQAKVNLNAVYAAALKNSDDLSAATEQVTIDKLNILYFQIDEQLTYALNSADKTKAKSLRVLMNSTLEKAQWALKIGAAEEARFTPQMWDTAHPMLVYGYMNRSA